MGMAKMYRFITREYTRYIQYKSHSNLLCVRRSPFLCSILILEVRSLLDQRLMYVREEHYESFANTDVLQ